MAVGRFPEKGGDADGKRSLGPCPAFRGMLTHRPCGDAVHSPKCVLAARLAPGRLTLLSCNRIGLTVMQQRPSIFIISNSPALSLCPPHLDLSPELAGRFAVRCAVKAAGIGADARLGLLSFPG